MLAFLIGTPPSPPLSLSLHPLSFPLSLDTLFLLPVVFTDLNYIDLVGSSQHCPHEAHQPPFVCELQRCTTERDLEWLSCLERVTIYSNATVTDEVILSSFLIIFYVCSFFFRDMKLTRSHQCVHATIAISCGSPYRSSITTRGTEKTGTSVLARYASSFRPLNLFLYRYLFLYISVFIFIYFDLVNFLFIFFSSSRTQPKCYHRNIVDD